MLTKAPILKVANMDKDFVVCRDTCKEGLGIMLQDDHVIAYESWKLKDRDKHYGNLLTGVYDYARNGGRQPRPGSLEQAPSCLGWLFPTGLKALLAWKSNCIKI